MITGWQSIVVAVALTVHVPDSATCICNEAKVRGGWCTPCRVGYVASFSVPSKHLYEALEPHGHKADPSSVSCTKCKEAARRNGFCSQCNVGWVDDVVLLSRLAHHLAKGTPIDRGELTCCPSCLKNSERHGWCTTCQRGMIGNVAVKPKTEFESGSNALEIALRAIEMLAKCEKCAVAMAINGRCSACKIFYHDGKPADVKREPRPSDATQK